MKFIIKRTLPVFLSLFAVIFLFSGCGDKSENEVLKGKWVPVSAVIDGETYNTASLSLRTDILNLILKETAAVPQRLRVLNIKAVMFSAAQALTLH